MFYINGLSLTSSPLNPLLRPTEESRWFLLLIHYKNPRPIGWGEGN
jgi:hypothetical protein